MVVEFGSLSNMCGFRKRSIVDGVEFGSLSNLCGFRERSIVDGVDCILTSFVEAVSSSAVRLD